MKFFWARLSMIQKRRVSFQHRCECGVGKGKYFVAEDAVRLETVKEEGDEGGNLG